MTAKPRSVSPDELASEALRVMNEANITLLFVCDDGVLMGALHMHDLLHAKIA